MICSSLARNRSPDPVVSCCFGRIVPPMRPRNHSSFPKGIPKTKLQGSAPSSHNILQSQSCLLAKNRFSVNGLAVVHGRLLKKELLGHLRSTRTIRRSKRADPNGDQRGQIKDLISIRERPAAVEDRAVPGHWEGDLLSGSKNSYIATLVERHTRYVMLAKVANKDTQTVVSALIKQAKKLPNELYKSLTWDRGKELTDHRRFTLATNIDVYFCDPQSP